MTALPARLQTRLLMATQLPIVVTQALQLLERKEPDFDQLIRTLSADPMLVARIMSIANSPLMGRIARATSPRAACVTLGVEGMRSAVLAVGLTRHLRASDGNMMVINELWAHAFATAAAARCLAPLCGAPPEMAYTAGLLHDIGKIVLVVHAWPEYQEVLACQAAGDCFIGAAERSVLGTDHVEVGALIARRWQLPDYLVDSIEHQQSPEYAAFPIVADVVHVANVVARALALGNPGDDLVPAIHPLVMRRRNLPVSRLAERFPDIEAAFEEILDFMG
ncbi:MAG: HDOD domain-containing protein [Pseudomonadota bacterium]